MKIKTKIKRAYYKLLNQKRQEITIIIIFIIAVAIIGAVSNIEAYEPTNGTVIEQNNSGQRNNNQTATGDNRTFKKPNGSGNSGLGRLQKQEINPLCSLNDVVCPNEKIVKLEKTVNELTSVKHTSLINEEVNSTNNK